MADDLNTDERLTSSMSSHDVSVRPAVHTHPVVGDAAVDDSSSVSAGSIGIDDPVPGSLHAEPQEAVSTAVVDDYGPGEVTVRGDAIYRDRIQPRIAPLPKGTFVVIDINSGDYEIGTRDAPATRRLFERRPSAVTHAVRVGYRTAYRHTGWLPNHSQRA